MKNIGLISYLNAIPINFFLKKILGTQLKIFQFNLDYQRPSSLATNYKNQLYYGSFVPIFDFLYSPYYSNSIIFDGIGISSQNQKEVKSVLLFLNTKLDKIKKVAIDKSSLSSHYLLKILLKELFKLDCQFFSLSPKDNLFKSQFDAYLLIGDDAIIESNNNKKYLDLGKIWSNWTSLPFTFAIFVCQEKNLSLKKILIKSKNIGMKKISWIVQQLNYQNKKFLLNYYKDHLCFSICKNSIFLYQKLLFKNKFISNLNEIYYF